MGKKVSLVLEGGGLRGAYTAGCLSWLIDEGIEFEGNYGISTGAVNICAFLMKSKKHLFDFFTKYVADKNSIGLLSFLRSGKIVDYDHLFDDVMASTGFRMEDLNDYPNIARIGLYDLHEGATGFHDVQEMDLAMLKASCSLPILGRIVKKGDHEYLDGGITKMIPIEKAIEDGMEKHLVIATKPLDYVRKPANIFVRFLMKIIYRRCPQIEKDYRVRHLNYRKQVSMIRKMMEEGNALYMCPSKKTNVTRLGGSHEELVELYELGRSDMEANREKIYQLIG